MVESDSSYPTITMTKEEFEKIWFELNKPYTPKKIFYHDGKYIAGENISMGDAIYISSPTNANVEEQTS